MLESGNLQKCAFFTCIITTTTTVIVIPYVFTSQFLVCISESNIIVEQQCRQIYNHITVIVVFLMQLHFIAW